MHEKRGEVPSERHTSDKQYWLSSTLSRRKPQLMGKREPERNRPLRLRKLRQGVNNARVHDTFV